MIRDDRYQLAKDRVKISHFTEKGIDFNGVIHVGTNDGYEIVWYRMMGLKVIGFEPLESAYNTCAARYAGDGEVFLCNFGVGTTSGVRSFYETVSNRNMDDSGGSSFLREIEPSEHVFINERECLMMTVKDILDLYPNIRPEEYDCLVVDVQGMELDVLKSFEEAGILKNFKGLNIECSRQAWYEGEADAQEVIMWLNAHGFYQDSPIEDHNDIMYIREDIWQSSN